MRNITPIVTPISVKKLFSFWTRICANASQTASMIGKRFEVGGPAVRARSHTGGGIRRCHGLSSWSAAKDLGRAGSDCSSGVLGDPKDLGISVQTPKGSDAHPPDPRDRQDPFRL